MSVIISCMRRRVLVDSYDGEFYGMILLHIPRILKYIMKKKISTKSELAEESGMYYHQVSREVDGLDEKSYIAKIPADIIRKSKLGKIADIDPHRGRKSEEVIINPWNIDLDMQLVEELEEAVRESDLSEEDKRTILRKFERIKQLWDWIKATSEE